MTTLVILLALLVLLLAGVPVAFALGAVGLGLLWLGDFSVLIVPQTFLSSIDSFILLAVPLFLLMSNILLKGGVGHDLFAAVQAWVGHWPGGLAVTTIVSCGLFAAISGSSVATAATIGTVAIPEMVERGYPQRFSVGITGAASIISPVIPPSVALVVYGWLSGTSIAALFMAGVIPGIILAVGLSLTVLVTSYWLDLPGTQRVPGGEVFGLFLQAIPPLMTPFIIIGGIWSGIFTPTEAGAVACMYAFLLGAVVYRDVTLAEFMEALRRTVRFTSVILFIIAIATFYGWLLVRVRIPQELAMALLDLNLGETQAIQLNLLFFLVIGCFMSVVEAVLIFTPIFMLTIQSLGIDPVWFGVLMVMTLSVGVITPPFGNVLFVLTELTGMPFEKVVVAILPFLVPILLTLLLLVFVPSLVTFLPDVMH